MPARVTFAVTEGTMPQTDYVFSDRTTWIIGRDRDCEPRVPNDDQHLPISRLHCLLDINPPDVRVRDMGSKYGTFIKERAASDGSFRKIGQRETEDQRGKPLFGEHDLKDGDLLRLGDPAFGQPVTFRVNIFVPILCGGCTAEIPEDQKARAERTSGVYQCEACRKKAEAAKRKEHPKQKARVCSKCGRDVSREMGEQRQGDFICSTCKGDPLQIMKHLLQLANSGNKDLMAIQGYEILRPLGRGGMGAVYLARHHQTGEQVALKVMLPKVAVDERATRMFLNETELTKALRHRHVVQVRDSGCSSGTFFFTLEYCDGGSVDKLMEQQGGPLSIDEAANLILQVLAGLVYAHNAEVSVRLSDGTTASARGLVHRDLKPQNIFLAGSGSSLVAKVGDYGLAGAFDTAGLSGLNRTGETAGTPYFMSRPQVVNFKYAKPDVDVWAAAASLYFMLTGHTPRDFPEDKDKWQVVLDDEPVPIRWRQPSIPPRLAEVIDEALRDKAQQDRKALPFKTAGEFKQTLESVL